MNLFVTGAAGFIGSSFARVAKQRGFRVIVLDALTYAGRMENIESLIDNHSFNFEKVDIRNFADLEMLFQKYKPEGVVHFAAESHVDNSINGPAIFVETNVMGTFNLLEASRKLCEQQGELFKTQFRFIHVSTDEVFGELGETGKFSESSPYEPSSPYSASKAASDHLVRAWHRTYGLNTIVTNCSNNYGPRQFPEKLIPRVILNALEGKELPVYGKGENIRDWIFVDDHAEGVMLAFSRGTPGLTYCLGGNSERKNIDVVRSICEILDRSVPRINGESYLDLIRFVEDRKGHDFRYAINDTFAQKELGYKRRFDSFEDGLEFTVHWYLENKSWIKSVSGEAL